MSKKRMKLIEDGLQSLNPLKIDIVDEGHLHVGHAGAKSGGHFKLYIVSEHFKGQSMVNRHKLIYQNLDELMKTEVHALSIKYVIPVEL
jgi:BolA protein